jgi:hypothetical protein
MKKEIDFSKGKRNKFAGKQIVIVGDRRRQLQVNSGAKMFHFINTRKNVVIKIAAENREEARQKFLKHFNRKRLPAGMEIRLAA